MSEENKARMRAILCKGVLAVVWLAFAVLAFAIGMEVGHRHGYDRGWRDCRFDAKEQLGHHFLKNETFWRWQGSSDSAIRKRRSFWFND